METMDMTIIKEGMATATTGTIPGMTTIMGKGTSFTDTVTKTDSGAIITHKWINAYSAAMDMVIPATDTEVTGHPVFNGED